MKYSLYTALLLTLVLLTSCRREHVDKYVTLAYHQTFCADPWTNAATDSVTLKNVATYLDASSIYIAGLYIKQGTSIVSCTACNCQTGKTIYVTTFENDSMKARLVRIGFQ